MILRVTDVIEVLERIAPKKAACTWDNPGLLVGRADKEVYKIFVVLDVTEEVTEEAIESGCDLIVSHHPIIFHGIKDVTDRTGIGRKLMNLLRNDISVYAMHTNFDAWPGGMADIVCRRLGLQSLGPLEQMGFVETLFPALKKERQQEPPRPYGIGFIAELPQEMSSAELAWLVKDRFGLPYVRFYDAGRMVKRLACCPGSGRGMFGQVVGQEVDAFVTGDMGHHDALDYREEGISLIDAGHYGLEYVFVEHVANYLMDRYGNIEIKEDMTNFPAKLV